METFRVVRWQSNADRVVRGETSLRRDLKIAPSVSYTLLRTK